MKKFLKEPLVLVIVFGVLLFIGYSRFDNYLNRDVHEVIVTNSMVLQVEQSFESRWNRPPTPEEKQALLDKYVKDIILYRTALEMGLDQDDQVIRGRMVQKLEFLGNDLIQPPQPSEQDLVTFYEKHKEKYIPEEIITLTHIYFDPDKRDEETLTDADNALRELQSRGEFAGDISGFGDAFMLQNYYPKRSVMEIRKLFGIGFTKAVFDLEPGQWYGPVLSGYGTHLVYIHNLKKGDLPPFEDIRAKIKEDWMADMQIKLNKRYIDGLMERYTVVYEEQL